MERVGGTGVPVEYPKGGRASALVHSVPASDAGCNRDQNHMGSSYQRFNRDDNRTGSSYQRFEHAVTV